MKINMFGKLLLFAGSLVALSSCYTIVNQPSVLPEDLRAQLPDSSDADAYITNNYYYYDGYYYNRPFYADRRTMRYDWFTNSYYFDPYYYNTNYFYDDMRWYHYRPRPYYYGGGGGGGTITPSNTTEKVRRTTYLGRDAHNTATAPDPGTPQYVIPSTSSSSSGGSSSSSSGSATKKTSDSSNDKSKSNTTREKKRKR